MEAANLARSFWRHRRRPKLPSCYYYNTNNHPGNTTSGSSITKRPSSYSSFRSLPTTFPRLVTAKLSLNSFRGETDERGYRGPKKPKRNLVADWVSANDAFVRILPIYVGGSSLLAVLLNRSVSGIAPVADAGSSQSRADLLALGLSVSCILTGLVWLSIRPKSISAVDPDGVECRRMSPSLPDYVASELEWFWESLKGATCCKSLVVIYDGDCILQTGMAAEAPEGGEDVSVDAARLIQGSLYQGIMKSGAQSYFANLSLYPARSELHFLPANTQCVISQPIGNRGIAIVGGNTIRGFNSADQAWISLIGDKLDATLTKFMTKAAL